MGKYGRWKIIGAAKSHPRSDGRSIKVVMCRCKCGTTRAVQWANIRSGKSKSCGCHRRKRSAETKFRHGHARKGAITHIYSCWQSMLRRCTNQNHRSYQDYGGRGIKVCRRWLKFENFLADMGRRPSPRHSLDRKRVNGNYTPKNCKWSLPREQRLNQRKRLRLDQFGTNDIVRELRRRGLRVDQNH